MSDTNGHPAVGLLDQLNGGSGFRIHGVFVTFEKSKDYGVIQDYLRTFFLGLHNPLICPASSLTLDRWRNSYYVPVMGLRIRFVNI